MPNNILQTRFNQGEFSPEMVGRSDIQEYYGAAETLENVVIIPQGGVKRRDCLRYIDTFQDGFTSFAVSAVSNPNGGTTANLTDENVSTTFVTTNNISTTNPYVVAVLDLGSDQTVRYVDIASVFLTVSGTSTGDFFIQVATSAAPTTWLLNPSGISLTTTGSSHRRNVGIPCRYIRLVKLTATDLGTNKISLTQMTAFSNNTNLTDTRLMPFEYNRDQTYIVVFVDRTLYIYEADETTALRVAAIPAPMFTSARLATINWTQSADTAIVVHEEIPPHKLVRGDVVTDWTFNPIDFDNKPIYDFVPVSSNPSGTITPSATDGIITITASAPIFTNAATDVNQILDGGGGRARIVEFISTTSVRAIVLIPFYSTAAIPTGAWVYEEGYDDAWSDANGWPNAVTFHDGRLWFAGTTELPQTIWASKVGLYFDFDEGQVFDDDAINITLDTDQVNEIVNLFSQRTLQIFTSGGEFAAFQSAGTAITPLNIDIRRQTQEGSEKGIRPSVVEGATIYMKKNGSAVMEFLYSDIEQAYSSRQITVASSHLIISPTDMAINRSNTDNEASLLYVVNSDGTMAVGSILKDQNVSGFTRFTTTGVTDGKFRNVAVSGQTTWAIVERTLQGVNFRYLEKFDSGFVLDHSLATSVENADRIVGTTTYSGTFVQVYSNGSNRETVYVPNGTETGSIISFADYGSTVAGTVLVTVSAATDLNTNHDVVITGTTNYNGTFTITKVSSTSFYIETTWISDDATGTWTAVANIIPILPSAVGLAYVGYNFPITVKDLPIEVSPNEVRYRTSIGKKKRISGVVLRVKNTSGIKVNGNEVTVPDYTATGSNTSLFQYTGLIRVDGLLDWDETGQVTITQEDANPFTLLSLTKEVNF